MLVTELLHRRIVPAGATVDLGRIDGVTVDDDWLRVAALHLPGGWVAWVDIEGFGRDTVTVSAATVARPGPPEGRSALGKRLTTAAGGDIGRITDVEFDSRTGAVRRLHTTNGPIRGAMLAGRVHAHS